MKMQEKIDEKASYCCILGSQKTDVHCTCLASRRDFRIVATKSRDTG
jgi:hypothetical protein